MMAFLNVLSFFLGILAWVLPVISFFVLIKQHSKWVCSLSLISLSACGTSLLCQLINTSQLVMISDWTALLDTMEALVFVATVLLVGTILLNGLVVYLYIRKK